MKVEKNIPIPKPRTGPKRRYPLETIAEGDSFFVACRENTPKEALRVRSTVGGAIYKYRKSEPTKRFTTRVVEENGVLGLRVWRMSDATV